MTDDTAELNLEVLTRSGLSDKLIGSCRVCIPSQLHREELIDRVIDLELPFKTKEKDKAQLDSRMGNIRLRMLYSREHEIPLRPPPNASSLFYYRDHYTNMRTGDLILYSGVGSMDSIGKLLSGTRYSRVGTIVRMPNKYTGVEKLYVFEVTRNLGRELDAFRETADGGAALYELFPHLHAVSATDIWWMPLKNPIDPTASANMVDWIKETVCRRQVAELPAVPAEVDEFFTRYELSLLKHPYAIAELCSASVATQALRLGGLRMPFTNYISSAQLMSADCFENPVLIRERSTIAMPPFYPPGMDLSAMKGASVTARRATVSAPRDSSPGGGQSNNNQPQHAADMIALYGNTVVAPKMRASSVAVNGGAVTPVRGQSPAPSFIEDHEVARPPASSSGAQAIEPASVQPSQAAQEQQAPKKASPPLRGSSPSQAPPFGGVALPMLPNQGGSPNAAGNASGNASGNVSGNTPGSPPGDALYTPGGTSYEIQYEYGASPAASPREPIVATVDPPRNYRQPTAQTRELPSQPPGPSRLVLQTMEPPVMMPPPGASPVKDEKRANPSNSATDASPQSSPSHSPRSGDEESPIEDSKPTAQPPSPPKKNHSEVVVEASAPPVVPTKPTKPTKPPKPTAKPKDARPLTQKPGALSTAQKEESEAASAPSRPRAVTSREPKPRALAAPTARGLTEDVVVAPEGDGAEPEKTASGEVGAAPSYPLAEDNVIASPKTKRSRGSRPSKRDEDGNSEKKKTKRKGKESDSPRGESSSPAEEAAITPEEEPKKRKTKNPPPPVPLKPTTLRAAPSLPPSPRDLKPDSPHHEEPVADVSDSVQLSTYKPHPARVLWDFDAMSETELSVPAGKIVTILGISDEWALVEYDGRKGAVPVAYLDQSAV